MLPWPKYEGTHKLANRAATRWLWDRLGQVQLESLFNEMCGCLVAKLDTGGVYNYWRVYHILDWRLKSACHLPTQKTPSTGVMFETLYCSYCRILLNAEFCDSSQAISELEQVAKWATRPPPRFGWPNVITGATARLSVTIGIVPSSLRSPCVSIVYFLLVLLKLRRVPTQKQS